MKLQEYSFLTTIKHLDIQANQANVCKHHWPTVLSSIKFQ